MFHSARLTLTAWYLLMIMIVSLLFSTVVYRALTLEFERFERMQRVRIQQKLETEQALPPPPDNLRPRIRAVLIGGPSPELIQEAKQRLLIILASVNTGILLIAGGVGYFLAGRTLHPIQDMVDEQNRFISDASHELRTPLTALRTSLEVYLRDKSPAITDARQLISDSLQDVEQLQSLTDSLLQLSQFQKPETPPLEAIQIKDILKSALRKVKPLALTKNITLTDRSKDCTVMGNMTALTEVFMLLLDNAIKYSPSDTVVTVSSEQKDSVVKVSVEDKGVGIDEQDIPHIFERFYRADNSRTKNKTHGYGLGLSIVKRVIELHNGTITVKSKKNKGSVFTVKLPLA